MPSGPKRTVGPAVWKSPGGFTAGAVAMTIATELGSEPAGTVTAEPEISAPGASEGRKGTDTVPPSGPRTSPFANAPSVTPSAFVVSANFRFDGLGGVILIDAFTCTAAAPTLPTRTP